VRQASLERGGGALAVLGSGRMTLVVPGLPGATGFPRQLESWARLSGLCRVAIRASLLRAQRAEGETRIPSNTTYKLGLVGGRWARGGCRGRRPMSLVCGDNEHRAADRMCRSLGLWFGPQGRKWTEPGQRAAIAAALQQLGLHGTWFFADAGGCRAVFSYWT